MAYADVPIPKLPEQGKSPDKNKGEVDPKSLTYLERRAVLLRAMVQAGDPRSVSQTAFAKFFGKSVPQINHDIKAIKKELKEQMDDSGDLKLLTQLVFRKTVTNGLKSDDPKKNKIAADTMVMWQNWAMDTGQVKRVPKELDIKDDRISAAKLRSLYEEEISTGKTTPESTASSGTSPSDKK